MPATSERQKRLMCLSWAIKLGKVPASKSPQAAKLAKTMSLKDLEEFCTSPIKEG